MIDRIRIRNFRSLHDVDVRLEPLTVLIGRSGSGKSNFVRAIRLLRDVLAGSVPQNAANHAPFGVDAPLGYEVDFRVNGIGLLSYRVVLPSRQNAAVAEESLLAGGRTIFHHKNRKWLVEPAVSPRPGAGGLALGTLTGVREATVAYVALSRGIACYDFTGTVLQDGAALEHAPGYQGTGDKPLTVASRILDSLDRLGDWASISKSLAALNARIRALDLLLPGRDQLRVGYELTDDKVIAVNASDESEGFRRYLAHLLALYQDPPRRTMLFEHPEAGIHPGALAALFEEFNAHVEDGRGQVILTTHSPQFLDHFKPSQIRVVEMDGDHTRIGPLDPDQVDTVKHGMMTAGELLTVDPARLAEVPAEVGP